MGCASSVGVRGNTFPWRAGAAGGPAEVAPAIGDFAEGIDEHSLPTAVPAVGQLGTRPVRPSDDEVRRRELRHLPCAARCETCVSAKSDGNRHAAHAATAVEESHAPRVQFDFMFMSSSGGFIHDPQATCAILTMVPSERGSVACALMPTKDHRYGPVMV